MLRLFVGIDVPYDSKIDFLMKAVMSSRADLKPVEPENLHLTLLFIGEVHESLLKDVKEAVSELKFPSFTVRLSGLGAFPNAFRPRVVWIGVKEGAERLAELHKQLVKGLNARGIRPQDEKEFQPHLTLARVKGNYGTLPQVIMSYQNYEVGTFNVDSVKLFKSTLTPKGPIYEVLHEVKAIDRGGSIKENKAQA